VSLFPHHDGSELYVSNSAPKVGEKVVLKVRVPHAYTFEKSFIRIYEDGEPRSYELVLASKEGTEDWYQVEVPIVNTHTLYRFVFVSRDKYDWLNAFGLADHDVHTNNDFQIVAVPANPEWIKSSVFYQIFPDRFAKSGNTYEIPDWAHPRDWNELPRGRSEFTSSELYGGDIPGVEQHLDHIHGLGVTGIYFTPFFSSRSNHRYDASSFTEVDPLLGGNEALFSLVKKANKLGIRIMGDLTSNHCGAGLLG
jgi:alpha-glucosidase